VVTKTERRRETAIVAVSASALTLALVVGLWMLFRARDMRRKVAEAETHVQLLDRRAELRARVAEMTSLKLLTAFPREQTDLDRFRGILTLAARRFAKDPLDGNADSGPFACEAIEFTSGGGQMKVWTSGIIDEEIRLWALESVSAQLSDDVNKGSRYVEQKSRTVGTSWAAFRVDGNLHIGALIWLTPRNP